MTAEEMKSLVGLAGRAWNEGRPELLDDVYAPSFINYSSGLDREGTKKALIRYRAAFSGLQLTTEDVITAGDRIIVRWTTRGARTASDVAIPAAGKRFKQPFTNIMRVENGRFVEEWALKGDQGATRQFGLLK